MGYEQGPDHRAYQRYFGKFTQAINQRVFDSLYGWFFSELCFDNYTLDFDSTVMERYGDQEGAEVGYNPKRPGRKSHHPLLAFVADLRMTANYWLRPGNTSASTNYLAFLDNTLERLQGNQVLVLLTISLCVCQGPDLLVDIEDTCPEIEQLIYQQVQGYACLRE